MKKQTPLGSALISAFCYLPFLVVVAVASIFAAILVAIACALFALFWPFVPFAVYWVKKEFFRMEKDNG